MSDEAKSASGPVVHITLWRLISGVLGIVLLLGGAGTYLAGWIRDDIKVLRDDVAAVEAKLEAKIDRMDDRLDRIEQKQAALMERTAPLAPSAAKPDKH